MLCNVAIWNYGEIPFVVNHSGIRRGAQTFQKRPRRHGNVNTDFITTRCEVCRKTRYLHFTAFLSAFTVCILTFPCLWNSWQTCWFCATLDTCVSSADGVCGLCFPRSCMSCRTSTSCPQRTLCCQFIAHRMLSVILSCKLCCRVIFSAPSQFCLLITGISVARRQAVLKIICRINSYLKISQRETKQILGINRSTASHCQRQRWRALTHSVND